MDLPMLSYTEVANYKTRASVRQSVYKKLSYRRESAHLTLLYRTVQKVFRYVEQFRRGSQVWQTDKETVRQTDRQIKSICCW